MTQSMPAVVRGTLRAASVVFFLGAISWCVYALNFKSLQMLKITEAALLVMFLIGKENVGEVLFSSLVVAAHAFAYAGLSVGPGALFGLLLWPLLRLDSAFTYAMLALPIIGFLAGIFHGCLRSLVKPPSSLFDDVMPSMMRAGLIGALFGLIVPFLEGIPFLEDMNIWGQLVLRIAVLPVAFLVGASFGVLPAIVDSYYMAEGESNRPTQGLKRTPDGAA